MAPCDSPLEECRGVLLKGYNFEEEQEFNSMAD